MRGRISLLALTAICSLFFASALQAQDKFELKADHSILAPGEKAKLTFTKNGKKVEDAFTLTADPPEGLQCSIPQMECAAPVPGKGLAITGEVAVQAMVAANLVASLKVVLTEAPVNWDEREDFEATFYTGASIDSFAAQDLNKYLNPKDASDKKTGYVVGIDFAYRLFGDQKSPHGQQLWVYGQTVHGQRSAEVDCSGNSPAEACAINKGTPTPGAFLAILRNASSLEAFSGVRWEFATLHANGQHAAKMYLKSELGFFTVAGSGGDVFDSHQKLAFGTVATAGRYRDSSLEFGWGKSDVFQLHPGRRFKVDAYLSWDLAHWMKSLGMKPFIEITLDSDFGRGADSVRTYYGFSFDLKHLTNPTPQ